MSLTIAKNGDVTLSKDRHYLCMSAVWEMEALAYLLPTLSTDHDEGSTIASHQIRCLASRFAGLSNALMSALYDSAEKTNNIAKVIYVRRGSGD